MECIFDLGNIIAWRRFEVGQFRHHHSGKTRTMALFWLRTSYHAQRYMLRSLLTQSFNIVNTPIILLFSKKWVPGLAAEDNTFTLTWISSRDNHIIFISQISFKKPSKAPCLLFSMFYCWLEKSLVISLAVNNPHCSTRYKNLCLYMLYRM